MSERLSSSTLVVACCLILAFVLHEAGHLAALRLLGEKAELGGGLGVFVKIPPGVEGWRLAVAAFGGPAVNLLLLFVGLGFGWQTLAQVNFVLAAVNLLPVLPLDGGRIVLGLLSGVVSWRRLAVWLYFLARSLALALAICVYYFGLDRWLLVAALWLYLLAMLGSRKLAALHLAALLENVEKQLRPPHYLPIFGDMPLYRVVQKMSPGWRNVVFFRGIMIDGDSLLLLWEEGKGSEYLSKLWRDLPQDKIKIN